jgi:HAD superfamily hydrolase (TIGR01509 family)
VSESKTMPSAVLWDMDGTLVDTEPYWIAAEFDIVELHGGTWTHEHAKALVGADLLDAGEYIRRHGGVERTPHDIVEMLLDRVVERIRAEVPWRPGARELLHGVRNVGIATALVTMSWKRFSDEVVACLPTGSFHVSVTGDEVERGKPHPDPYLLAAERLGVSPQQCVAIEDSPTGTRSALAAGCRVLGVPHHVDIPASLADEPTSIGRLTLRRTLVGISAHDLIDI